MAFYNIYNSPQTGCVSSVDYGMLYLEITGLLIGHTLLEWTSQFVPNGYSISYMIFCPQILTTHAMEEADHLCTRIGIMNFGKLRCLESH